MQLNEYLNECLKTWTKDPIPVKGMYLSLGLANEVGELLGKIKKVHRDKGAIYSEETKLAIGFEASDCLWYLAVLAYEMGFSLEEIARMNIDKLRSRAERNKINGDGDDR